MLDVYHHYVCCCLKNRNQSGVQMMEHGLQRAEVSHDSFYPSASEKEHSAELECHDFRC